MRSTRPSSRGLALGRGGAGPDPADVPRPRPSRATRGRAARALLLAGTLAAAACQAPEPPPDEGVPLPPAPDRARSICHRTARSTAPAGAAEVAASFQAFASKWLETRRAWSAPGTRREIADPFETELRATGDARSPYVGMLRYCEHELACADAAAERCTPAKRSSITEIFRFEAGEWRH
jgi:hypothetical protein